MTLTYALYLPAGAAEPDLSAIAGAFGVADDGFMAFEVGRPETGATCLIQWDPDPVDEAPPGSFGSSWRLLLPTLRAPWSARDLLPAATVAAGALGGRWDTLEEPAGLDPLAAWNVAHGREARRLMATCEATGAPPPPHRPGVELEAIHAALLGLAAAHAAGRPAPPWIHALDPADGAPTLFASRLPDGEGELWLPAVDAVLFDPTGGESGMEEPLCYPLPLLEHALRTGPHGGFFVDSERARMALGSAAGEPVNRYRFVTPVEVVDEEALRPKP